MPNALSVQDSLYVVVAGDTLRAIGNRTGAGSEAIASANGLTAPFTVKVGQRLKIPGGRYHQVASGEAGIAIARAYGTDWAALIRLNRLEPPYVLRIGQRLKLPTDDSFALDVGRDFPVTNGGAVTRAQAFSVNIDELLAGTTPAEDKGVSAAPSSVPLGRNEVGLKLGGFIWPITNGRVARGFGPYGEGRVNRGIDIATQEGTEIRAAATGVVVYAARDVAIFDGLILLRHADGWTTAYGYAVDIRVREGQNIRKGEVIGLVGPGPDQGPQLHFELRKGQDPVDPLRYFGS
jgi:murein DD-endopeptidase MepM/ murein hydrolase activator NlpD